MPKIQETKTTTGFTKYITLPKAICDLKGWKRGDILKFEEKDGNITIKKVE